MRRFMFAALATLLVFGGALPAAASSAGVSVHLRGVPAGEQVNVGLSYRGTSGPVFQSFQRHTGSGTVSFSVPSNAARVSFETSVMIGKSPCRLTKEFSSPPREVTFDFAAECKR